jgi:hypothetical protein
MNMSPMVASSAGAPKAPKSSVLKPAVRVVTEHEEEERSRDDQKARGLEHDARRIVIGPRARLSVAQQRDHALARSLPHRAIHRKAKTSEHDQPHQDPLHAEAIGEVGQVARKKRESGIAEGGYRMEQRIPSHRVAFEPRIVAPEPEEEQRSDQLDTEGGRHDRTHERAQVCEMTDVQHRRVAHLRHQGAVSHERHRRCAQGHDSDASELNRQQEDQLAEGRVVRADVEHAEARHADGTRGREKPVDHAHAVDVVNRPRQAQEDRADEDHQREARRQQ